MEHASDSIDAPASAHHPHLSRRERRRRREHRRALAALAACALIFLGLLAVDLASKPHPDAAREPARAQGRGR